MDIHFYFIHLHWLSQITTFWISPRSLLLSLISWQLIRPVSEECCLLIVLEYRLISLQYSCVLSLHCQSDFDLVLYSQNWEFPRHKKISPMSACPIYANTVRHLLLSNDWVSKNTTESIDVPFMTLTFHLSRLGRLQVARLLLLDGYLQDKNIWPSWSTALTLSYGYICCTN